MTDLSSFSRKARGKARASALQALYEWDMTSKPIDEIIMKFAADKLVSKRMDWPYFQEVLQAVSTQQQAMDDVLAHKLDRPLSELAPVEHMVLSIGLYELQSRPDMPIKVVINEAVKLAKRFGAEDSYKFINAVLDNLAAVLRPAEISD